MSNGLPSDLQEIETALASTRAYAESQRSRRLLWSALVFAGLLPAVGFFGVTWVLSNQGNPDAAFLGLGASIGLLAVFGAMLHRLFRHLAPVKRHQGGLYANVGLAAFLLAAASSWIAVMQSSSFAFALVLLYFSSAMLILQGLETRSNFWLGVGFILAAASATLSAVVFTAGSVLTFLGLLLAAGVLAAGVVYVQRRRKVPL